MNKVLVTGGLGRIGPFVCRALLGSSRQPVIYDASDNVERIRDIAHECLLERGDICDLPRLIGVISKHEPVAIVHLAAQIGSSAERLPWSFINTNLIGITTLFEAARLSGVQRVIFPSSRQVYGPIAEPHRHPTYEAVPEKHPREPLELYGKLKRICEDVAGHYAPLYGMDIIALRFGAAFGPGGLGRAAKMSPVREMIESAITNRPYRIEFGADQRDNLCYSGEFATGFIAALDCAPQLGNFRAYNIASDELISLGEMIAILKDLYPVWSAVAGPGLDYRKWGLGFYFKLAIDKARNELGFEPKFNFRSAALDYARTFERLQKDG